MPTIYDQAEHARLVSEMDKLETKRAEAAKKMHDMHYSDTAKAGDADHEKQWTDEQHKAYLQLQREHDFHQNEHSRISALVDRMESVKPKEKAKAKNEEASIYDRWMRQGDKGLTDSELTELNDVLKKAQGSNLNIAGANRDVMITPFFNEKLINDRVFVNDITFPGDSTAATSTTAVIDEETVQSVIYGLSDYGGALNIISSMMTSHGNDIRYPIFSDVVPQGETGAGAFYKGKKRAALDTPTDEQKFASFSEVTLGSHVYDTGFVEMSRYMQQDVGFDVGDFVQMNLRRRIGRTLEDLVLNQSSAKPASAAGRDADIEGLEEIAQEVVTANSNEVRWDDLVDLITQCDSAYLDGEKGIYGFPSKPGRIGFLTSWQFKGTLMKIQDTQRMPLWMPSIQAGMPSTLLGYPVYMSNSFAKGATGNSGTNDNALPIYFGNFGYMAARYSGPGLSIERHYDSGTAKANYELYLGRIRFDCRLIGPKVGGKFQGLSMLKIKA